MMDIWYKGEWITMDDFTGHEWDDFENFESLVEREADEAEVLRDIDDVVDRMMTDPGYYDRVVGWF